MEIRTKETQVHIGTYRARSAAARSFRPQQPPKQYSKVWAFVLILCDLTMIALAIFLASTFFTIYHSSGLNLERVIVSASIFAFMSLIIFWHLGMYRRSFMLAYNDEIYSVIAAMAVSLLPQLVLFTIFPRISASRVMMSIAFPIAIATVGSARALLRKIRFRWDAREQPRVAVVGSVDRVADVVGGLSQSINDSIGIYADFDVVTPSVNGDSGRHYDWYERARVLGCRRICLTEMPAAEMWSDILVLAARDGISIAIAPPRFKAHSFRLSLEKLGDQVLIVSQQPAACATWSKFVKRLIDVVGSLVALTIFAPIMLAVLAAIYFESGRPIFYLQERIGRDGRPFRIIKFRSMPRDAETRTGPIWPNAADRQTTRVGKLLRRTSLDELPQFFNVLRGDMSLVGPRPERPMFVRQFTDRLTRYNERHLVRPGITGFSQVYMKRNPDQSMIGERLSYDLFYVEHWTPFLDISILFKTAAVVFFQKGA